MAVPLSTYSPVMLVDIYLSTTTYRTATKDSYIGLDDEFYKGTLLEFPSVTEELSDVFYGVEQTSAVTIRLSNIDNGIDDTWDDIRDAEEIRGVGVRLRRYELINTGILLAENGDTLIAEDTGAFSNYEFLIEQHEVMEYRGKIIDYEIGDETVIRVEMRQDDTLETLLPLKVVTPDEFTATAMGLGEVVNLCLGKCRNVPLRNIQNNTADDEYDYLIGYGVIEGLRVDHPNGLGVRREGVLVTATEYTLYDGSQATPYPGYAFIRFTVEQMNFSGGYHTLTADVNGLEMGGASAQRNFARTVRNLLSDTIWGLSDTIDIDYFNAAAAALDTITDMYCDLAIVEQRQARDILDDLLFPSRGSIGRTDAGDWWMEIDTTGAAVLNLGDNDGYYDNAEIKSIDVVPSDSSLRKAIIHYDFSAGDATALKELTLDVHSTFGIERTYLLPAVAEDVTAKKVLSYMYGRSTYSEKKATVIAGMEARDIRRGKIVTLTRVARNLAAEEFKVDRITRRASSFEMDCRSYDSRIYDDQVIASPTAPTDSGPVSTGPSFVATDIIQADGVEIVTDKIRARDGDGLLLEDDGGNGIEITDGGIVHMAEQSGCHVYINTAGTFAIAANVEEIVAFNAESYDIQGEFDSAVNYRFTAQKAGRYSVCAFVRLAVEADQNNFILTIKINGVAQRVSKSSSSSANPQTFTIASDFSLSANDFIEIWVENNANDTVQGQDTPHQTWLSIRKIG